MIEINKNIQELLISTARIARHQEEIKNLRGESFNLFSILRMESRENGTHSAFLGELLNPQGSHLLKGLFLELFLKTINYQGALEISSAKLILEKHIGNRSDELKTGGRIDIYIYDANGNSICIENKIYATDQYAQIERYVNHNKGKNSVYYLTLNGEEATKGSKGSLEEVVDYFCISYKSSIVTWLEKCLREAVEQPILRESIKQYIILIKKLTNQLTDNNMEKELQDLLTQNYAAAKIIEDNVWKIELDAVHSFLVQVKDRIEKELKEDWDVIVDEDLTQSWKGLKIEYKDWDGIFIKLQGEPKLIGGNSIYGIVAHKETWDRDLINSHLSEIKLLHDGSFQPSAYWPYYKKINAFTTKENIMRLFDEKQRTELIEDIYIKLIELAKECKDTLSGIKRIVPL